MSNRFSHSLWLMFQKPRYPQLPGVVLVTILAVICLTVSAQPWFRQYGISALSLGILVGLILGNTWYPRFAGQLDSGTDVAKGSILRVAIILYGLKISFQQIAEVGFDGVLTALLMMLTTFSLTLFLGVRIFKLDRQTAILIGAGSSICGAAAVLATESVIRAKSNQASVAVATVVIFGTLAMFVYPMIYTRLGLAPWQFGIYVGSTIHEVAQVLVVGNSAGELAAASAIIEKMSRVMMLAPFLLILSMHQSRQSHQDHPGRITIPWFAILFVAVSGIHSLISLPIWLNRFLLGLDNLLLTMAMIGLGLKTHLRAVREAGLKPILLAGCAFGFLMVGGYVLNFVLLPGH
ncbi:YeiH family protein [Gynuella sp.]|uniref:YeiH family protein n=1 Tax=Gynuella sp. TaxID=2969146 RepID=UPI003D0CD084